MVSILLLECVSSVFLFNILVLYYLITKYYGLECFFKHISLHDFNKKIVVLTSIIVVFKCTVHRLFKTTVINVIIVAITAIKVPAENGFLPIAIKNGAFRSTDIHQKAKHSNQQTAKLLVLFCFLQIYKFQIQ